MIAEASTTGHMEGAKPSHQVRASTSGRMRWSIVMVAIAASDVVALAGAFALAYLVRFGTDLPIFQDGPARTDFYLSVGVWAMPIWLGIFALSHLYDDRYLFAGFDEYNRVAIACTVGALSIIVISFFYEMPSIARAWLLMVWLFSIGMVWIARFLFRRAVWQMRVRGRFCRPAVVVGSNEEGRALAAQLTGMAFSGTQIVGFIGRAHHVHGRDLDGLPVLGTLDELEHVIDQYGIRDVVIATTSIRREELLELYRRFGHDQRVELRLSSGLFEILTTGARLQDIGGIPLMSLDRVRITGVDAVLKASLDVLGSATGLLVLSPILLVVACAVRLDGRGPILHRRRVLGRNGEVFDAFKFRSMIPDRRTRSQVISFVDRRITDKSDADPRVTRIGRFLRRTSLDELPQLFNVLRGDMSLVGPRMISPQELWKFGPWQVNLLTVKPGITGPWQVRGRATIPYEERVRLNMEYIRAYSIWLDLEILLRTVPAVIRGKGAF